MPNRVNERRQGRKRVSASLFYKGPGADTFQKASTYDLSETGVSFRCATEFSPGERLQVHIASPHPSADPMDADVAVVRVEREGNQCLVACAIEHRWGSAAKD